MIDYLPTYEWGFIGANFIGLMMQQLTDIRLTVDWYLQNSDWVSSVMDGSYQEYYKGQYGTTN